MVEYQLLDSGTFNGEMVLESCLMGFFFLDLCFFFGNTFLLIYTRLEILVFGLILHFYRSYFVQFLDRIIYPFIST